MGFLSWSVGYSYCLSCDGSFGQLPHQLPSVDINISYPTLPILSGPDIRSWLRSWLVIESCMYVPKFWLADITFHVWRIGIVSFNQVFLLVYNILLLVRHLDHIILSVLSWDGMGNFCSCIIFFQPFGFMALFFFFWIRAYGIKKRK